MSNCEFGHSAVLLKSDLDVQQTTHLWGQFIEHLSQTLVAQQSVTKFIVVIIMNLFTFDLSTTLAIANLVSLCSDT
jgi:hypothetical protein